MKKVSVFRIFLGISFAFPLKVFLGVFLGVFLVFASFSSLAFSSLWGDSQADPIWEKVYQQALVDLQFANAVRKAQAAYILGGQSNPRFVRPLLRELLHQLGPDVAKGTGNDPYVKSVIAGALAKIGHPFAVPGLKKALQQTITLARKDIEERKEYAMRARAQAKQVQEQRKSESPLLQSPTYLLITPARPGPYQAAAKSPAFYYNADQYWSVADDFKNNSSGANPLYEMDKIRMEGANYWNLLRSIFQALGSIGNESALEVIAPYLNPTLYRPIVRVYASMSLSLIATPQTVEILLQRFDAEKAAEVRLAMAYAVLRADKTRSKMYFTLTSYLQSDLVPLRLDAAYAFRNLSMGESLESLKAAYIIEDDARVLAVLKAAIHNAEENTIVPLNLR